MGNFSTPEVTVESDTLAYSPIYVQILCFYCTCSLLVYSFLLSFDDEVKFIWKSRTITLPSFFYVLLRYFSMLHAITQILTELPTAFVQQGRLRNFADSRTCDILANVGNASSALSCVGMEGLLISRVYSVTRFKWFTGVIFGLSYFCSLSLYIYVGGDSINIAINVFSFAVNVLGFAIILYELWDTVKLGGSRAHKVNSVTTLVFRQEILRFSFVVCITVISIILDIALSPSNTTNYRISSAFNILQQAICTVMTCEFLLQLRKQNKAQIENIPSFPTLSLISTQGLHTVMQHIHHSIIAEMGDHNNNGNFNAGSSFTDNHDTNDIRSLL